MSASSSAPAPTARSRRSKATRPTASPGGCTRRATRSSATSASVPEWELRRGYEMLPVPDDDVLVAGQLLEHRAGELVLPVDIELNALPGHDRLLRLDAY